MGAFYLNGGDVRREFETLPTEVRNLIIESGIEIESVEQLRKTANQIKNLSDDAPQA